MVKRTKFTFEGKLGEMLSGLLEEPDTEKFETPVAYALMAHCFTCGKDIASASRIARALVDHGFAVLRFDFTGLGGSDGDFSNTNFSSNVGDLIAAANFLREKHAAPHLLIGHSLGGTAVLAAAHHIPEVKGVVTIGSPADPEHVAKQFSCDIGLIESEGEAEVDLAGRTFVIKKQFLDDIRDSITIEKMADLKCALLIFHSPTDATVSIKEAETLYTASKHPKSFVSLDSADHLLSKREDAIYVANVIASWATRYID